MEERSVERVVMVPFRRFSLRGLTRGKWIQLWNHPMLKGLRVHWFDFEALQQTIEKVSDPIEYTRAFFNRIACRKSSFLLVIKSTSAYCWKNFESLE